MKFTDHWLRYSTTPNVLTRSTKSKQTITHANFHTPLTLIAPSNAKPFLSTCVHRAYPNQYDKPLITTEKLGVELSEREPAMICHFKKYANICMEELYCTLIIEA